MHPKRSSRSGRLDVEHRVYLDASIAIEDDEEDEDDEDAVERTSKPKSVWIGGEFSTDSGKRALKELLPGEVFDFPKAIDFLRTCVLLGSGQNDIVLDMFAGSGSLAQAVMQQNATDGQSRRYVCIQLPEPLDPLDKAQRAGADLCDQLGLPRTLAELTKERIRRAGARLKEERHEAAGDVGFRTFRLQTSNLRAWEGQAGDLSQTLLDHQDHVVAGRTEQDLLYELLLKLGLDLCIPIQQQAIAGKSVHAVGAGVLLACLTESIAVNEVEVVAEGIVQWYQELAPAGEITCVFRDNAFADDVAKTNMAAILQQHGIQNVRSL
jgi:adenine-specific DNA-methyltransferase